MVYGEFFGEIVAKWKKEPNLEGRFFWVQGKNLEGVHVKQQSEGGGGGVRCDLIFFPYLHQHESEAESQAKLFVPCFAIENKKCAEKKIVRITLLLITLFSMLKTVCLGYRTRKNV